MFKALDFAVEAGARIAIVGPSGSGKSTLLRCLVALEPFDGKLLHRDAAVSDATVLNLRRDVVCLAQTPAPVGTTLEDNLRFARDAATDGLTADEQAALLDRFGLGELPGDRPFDRLSVGERQRVCFVRAMTLQPSLLLLDEPTSALDDANVELLESMVSDWLDDDSERAAVWVTHDDAQAERIATRELVLEDGVLEEPT